MKRDKLNFFQKSGVQFIFEIYDSVDKYLYISNCNFTMKRSTVKEIILSFFPWDSLI